MSYDVVNPATEQVVTTVPLADVAETDAAVARARKAFDSWRHVAPADRGRLLRRFAEVVDAHVEELARLEVRNSGNTIGNARWEAGNVRDVLTYYSAAPERLFGRQIPVAGGVDLTFHEPLGVVGVIVPWNFPMPIAGWAFAPALAAGNTVVLKPAELTPLTAMRLGELALEAGLPEDVFTVLPGKGSVVGQRLVEHPDVRKIVFTGSTAVGKGVMAGCADRVKRVTLELGGKSANVVFADADLERAAATSVSAKTMFALLPPSSSVTRFTWSAQPAMIRLPTVVDPVKQTLRTSGCVTNRSPTTDPLPGTTLRTPAGRPASTASSPIRIAVSGVISAGLSTTVLPAASAGPSFQAAMTSGKFQGTMMPTTPSGSWNVTSVPPGTGICRPKSRSGAAE